jgi:hypothetical protein
MAGVLIGSIGSGQVITATGRYRWFPIAGTAIATVGMLLLSRLDAGTSTLYATAAMFVMGLGLGLVMQVLVLAVQNAVDHRDVGVATSGATLFRFIGGSIGTAVLGAIFASRLSANLARLPLGTVPRSDNGVNLQVIAALAPASRGAFIGAFAAAVQTIFTIAFFVATAGVVVALLIPEKPLRSTVAAHAANVGEDIGDGFSMPTQTDEHETP